MIEITGKYNSAVVYADKIDPETKTQIATLLRQPVLADSKIRIMPDTHTGRNCVVGLTMTIVRKKVIPAFIGADIGCGMRVAKIAESSIDLPKLDRLIHENIPGSSKIRNDLHPLASAIDLSKLHCAGSINSDRAYHSLGSLGGGNHFIELGRGQDGAVYLVIHSGSRQLGSDVSTFYKEEAYRDLVKKAKKTIRSHYSETEDDMEYSLHNYKAANRERNCKTPIKIEYAYAENRIFDDYLDDLAIVQDFAQLNRQAMEEVILDGMGLHRIDGFDSVHNYIDPKSMILRKGAVSARFGERLIIPLNMRDGSLICKGLGNAEWNHSAPHGAGRSCSRTDARHAYTVESFTEQMQGIYSTTVSADTLDECPMAYKSADRIVPLLTGTAEIMEIIKPIYNFKAGK